MTKAAKKTQKMTGKKSRFTAASADLHHLYEMSVQAPEADIEFFRETYVSFHGDNPKRLLEDFCGTAQLACLWASYDSSNEAWGVDFDQPTLDWGKKNHLLKLSDEAQKRVNTVCANVLDKTETIPPVDVIAAQNFSFCIFKERDTLKRYFQRSLDALAKGGILVLDLFGGPEALMPQEEETEYEDEGFSYVWDQKAYNPITNEIECAIHFRFPDGTEVRDAFTYDWRLWTPRELTELLIEVGFKDARVYWEGADEEGEGDGDFEFRQTVENEEAWVAYVVGLKR